MPINQDDKKRIQQLRERRMRLADERERAKKRARHGDLVVARVNSTLGTKLALDSFDVTRELSVKFERSPNFNDCPGLVAANTSERRLREILKCCDSIVGSMRGVLGFDDYSFLGTAAIESITMTALLDAAKSLQDSVLFCPDQTDSIVLVDHYPVSGVPHDLGFSIVIQGAALEANLAACFQNVVKLETAK